MRRRMRMQGAELLYIRSASANRSRLVRIQPDSRMASASDEKLQRNYCNNDVV